MGNKIAVLDVGNAEIKARRLSGKELAFKHAMIEISSSKHAEILNRYGADAPHDFMMVTDRQDRARYYVVGDKAESYGLVTNKRGQDRYTDDYYGVLALAAIARLYPQGGDVTVYASHPPGHYRYTRDLMEAIFGVWSVAVGAGRDVQINVTYINVFDEPIGGFMNALLTDNGAAYQNSEIAGCICNVLDFGGGTADIATVNETGEIEYALAESFPVGIIDALSGFELAIRDRYTDELKANDFLQPARVRDAFKSGILRTGGYDFDVLAEAETARNALLNRIQNIYSSRLAGGTRADVLLLTGGGSALLYDHLLPILNHPRVYLADNLDSLQWANVRGGCKLFRLGQAQGWYAK